jgi:tripartite-type tricarboxylate transporter receptor subunit TctC
MKRRQLLKLAAAPMALATFPALSQGSFPSKPIRWIVPFAAGGGTDVVVRLLAKELEAELGQSIAVDNKPGGSTIIGAQTLLTAPPDGYTWLAANTDTLATNPHLYKKLPYDTHKSFDYAGLFARWPFVLVGNKNIAPDDIAQLLSSLRTRKDLDYYASYGLGSLPHLGMELLTRQIGAKMTHVAYKGSAPALQGVLAGEVSLMLLDVTTALPQIKGGNLKAFAVSTRERNPLLPQLPTLQEAGVANFELTSWAGVVLPKGVDPAVLSRISTALARGVKKPDFGKMILERGAEPFSSTSSQFKALVDSDGARLQKVVSDNNIVLD